MKNLYRAAIVLLIILQTTGWGQSILSQTIPFGLPLRSLSGTALGMGGVSVGITNDYHTLLSNPGNLGSIDKVAFSSLILLDYMRINDNGNSSDHIDIMPRQLSFALPLGAGGTIAFSLVKETNAIFKYSIELSPNNKKSIDNTGGITTWQGGWGRKIGKYINAGLVYQRLFLKLNNVSVAEFTKAKDSTFVLFRGNAIKLGILSTVKNISAGISFRYVFKDSIKYFNGIYNGNTIVDPSLENNSKYSIQLPSDLSLGLSYAFSPKLTVGTDMSFVFWKMYSIGNPDALAKVNTTKNTTSICLGANFIPEPNLLNPKFYERMHYRVGFRYTQLPTKLSIHKSQEISGSIGCGLPLVAGNGLLDLGIEVGQRTLDKYKDLNETFFLFSIGINGGRKWSKSSTSSY